MQNCDDIPVGAIVKLKSGGPLMTVTSINQDQMSADESPRAVCQWFVKNAALTQTFALSALSRQQEV